MLESPAGYPPAASVIAAELGVVETLGTGSAPTRAISCSHWAALNSLAMLSGEGALCPVGAEWAAFAAVAALALLGAGGSNTISM